MQTPRGPQILNVALFSGALVGLGCMLGAAFVQRTDEPEISEDENRTLASMPELRWSAIVDGSFSTGVDEWVADHFPVRDRFMAAHFWLEERRGFRPEQEVAFYAVEIDHDAELEPLEDELLLDELDEIGAPLDDDLDDLELLDDADEPGEIVKTEGILVHEGRAMQLFSGGPKGSRRYAKVINQYAEALGDEVRIYSLIVPTAQTYYLPEAYEGRVRHEPPNIAATYALMDPSVTTVDVVGALAPHVDEYIYFRTDHHWTGLGAYYAYAAFCQAAGFEPVALAAMDKRRIERFRGSLYRYTRDAKLRQAPDQVEYWVPEVEVEVERYLGSEQKKPYAGELLREQSSGYGVFLGGDHPLLIARTDRNTGRRALVIKNSYGNAFAVYLVAHFDAVLIVDYRKFEGSVLELIEQHQITDLIIINGAITANAGFHIRRVAYVLNEGKPVRKHKPAAE
ncbi:MAG: hypothetical protein HC927_11630 [Deltaproteobacteria bacterium]|nr:hypothetical protein [Deltaproteobacteria bacterium]